MSPSLLAGLMIILAVLLLGLVGPRFVDARNSEVGSVPPSRPPSATHPLGTDSQGRDMLTIMVIGTPQTLKIGLIAGLVGLGVGLTLGLIAGFFGGWVDGLLMRFTDILLSVPQILLLISAAALFKASLQTTVIVIGLTSWPGAARIVRGQFLALKNQEFVTAARAIGATPAQIMRRHLFPNALAIIIVEATLWLSFAILLEACLSYLGLGVQIPTPSWGNMLQDGQRDLLVGAWWMTVFPGMAIFITVLAFNLMGDGLRDALDPRLRRR